MSRFLPVPAARHRIMGVQLWGLRIWLNATLTQAERRTLTPELLTVTRPHPVLPFAVREERVVDETLGAGGSGDPRSSTGCGVPTARVELPSISVSTTTSDTHDTLDPVRGRPARHQLNGDWLWLPYRSAEQDPPNNRTRVVGDTAARRRDRPRFFRIRRFGITKSATRSAVARRTGVLPGEPSTVSDGSARRSGHACLDPVHIPVTMEPVVPRTARGVFFFTIICTHP